MISRVKVKYNRRLGVWQVMYYGALVFQSNDELIAYAYANHI